MTEQGRSPYLNTSKSSFLDIYAIPNNCILVKEPISPLQSHPANPPGPATSLSDKEANAPSTRSVISILSDDCEAPAGNDPYSAIVISSDESEHLATVSKKKSQNAPSRIEKANMPYNNTAIPPSEEITGSTALPLARVKRILQADEEINPCSNSAAFAITVATEMFIRYLAEKSLEVVKSERKPRRNIQYKDVANAVARFDNLEFLSDVVPKTITYGEYKRRKSEKDRRKQELQNGQTTLNAPRSLPKRQTEVIDVDKEFPDDQDEPINGHDQAGPSHINGQDDMMEEHETNDDSRHGGSEDVDMN
ncbi:MAG: hypothetical protein Q9195_006738 [Heterodermia aff. obscurata]